VKIQKKWRKYIKIAKGRRLMVNAFKSSTLKVRRRINSNILDISDEGDAILTKRAFKRR